MIACMKCESKPAVSTRWSVLCDDCAAEMDADIAEADAKYSKPPCQECGAMTPEEAEKLCRCGGDKDDCHGCHLWPD